LPNKEEADHVPKKHKRPRVEGKNPGQTKGKVT